MTGDVGTGVSGGTRRWFPRLEVATAVLSGLLSTFPAVGLVGALVTGPVLRRIVGDGDSAGCTHLLAQDVAVVATFAGGGIIGSAVAAMLSRRVRAGVITAAVGLAMGATPVAVLLILVPSDPCGAV